MSSTTSQLGDEVHSWSPYMVTHEWYAYDDAGQLTSVWSTETKRLDICVRDQPLALGTRKEVSIVSEKCNLNAMLDLINNQIKCAPHGQPGVFVGKKINLPGEWWLPWGNQACALWLDAQEMVEFYFALRDFKRRASNMDAVIYSVCHCRCLQLQSSNCVRRDRMPGSLPLQC